MVYAAVPDPLEIEVEPREQSTFSEKIVTYTLTIHNNREIDDSFVVRMEGRKLYWLTVPVMLTPVEAHSSKSFEIRVFPSEEITGRFDYTVTVSSYTSPELRESSTLTVEILPPLIMNSFTGSLEENKVTTAVELVTGKEMTVEIAYEIHNSAGERVLRETRKETVNGVASFVQSFLLPKLPAGDYVTTITVNGELTDSFVFTINPIHNVVERMRRETSPLAEEIIVTLTNDGNVVERDYRTQKTTPATVLTGFITDPEECSIEGEDRRCTYVIEELGLGETQEIRYRLEFYPTYIQIALSIIIVIGIVMYSFKTATKPKVSKRHMKKTKNIHSIIIEIRNPFFHNLKNVIVRDWITPLAQVVGQFEHMQPVVRKSEAGTELIWKLGDMKPNETRYINYKLRTLVGGSLKMPKARVRFRTPNGKKWKVKSNHLVIE